MQRVVKAVERVGGAVKSSGLVKERNSAGGTPRGVIGGGRK